MKEKYLTVWKWLNYSLSLFLWATGLRIINITLKKLEAEGVTFSINTVILLWVTMMVLFIGFTLFILFLQEKKPSIKTVIKILAFSLIAPLISIPFIVVFSETEFGISIMLLLILSFISQYIVNKIQLKNL